MARIVALTLLLASLSFTSAFAAEPKSAGVERPVKCAVTFVNRGPGVTLRINGGPWVPLSRDQRKTFTLTEPQLTYVSARGTHWQYSAKVDLRNQPTRLIELTPPGSYLRVINRSEEPRLVRWGQRTLGVVKRRADRVLGPLKPGKQVLHATGVRSGDVQVYTMTLKHGASSVAVLGPVAAALNVKNSTNERARVLVDHQDYGLLAPGDSVKVTGLAPGVHRIELHGLVSGHHMRTEGTVSAAVTSGVIALTLVNQTGEEVALVPALGRLLDRPVRVGETVTLQVPAKRFQLRVVGRESRLVYRRDMQPKLQKDTWTLKRPRGQLHLTNHTGEAATVEIAGRPPLTIARDRSLTVRKVPAGAVTVVVKTASGRTFKRGLVLPANGDLAWRVSAGKTRLVISNRFSEELVLYFDGAPRGRIRPGAKFRIEGVRPGRHRAQVTSVFSKRRESATVDVADGVQTQLVFAPPQAGIRVNNPTDAPVHVVVRGEHLGVVAAKKSRAFAVVGGRLVVAVRGQSPEQERLWKGRLAPGQHLQLRANWTPSRRLKLINRGAKPLLVGIKGHTAVKVAAGGSHTFRGLAVGEHLVSVNGEGVRRRERVLIAADAPEVTLEVPLR